MFRIGRNMVRAKNKSIDIEDQRIDDDWPHAVLCGRSGTGFLTRNQAA